MNDNTSSINTIRARRSIRRYADRPIDQAAIDVLVESASHAPSAHNRQPWRFAVVTSAEAKKRLACAMGMQLRADRLMDGDAVDAIEADVARSHKRITAAPVVILACLSMRDMDTWPDVRRAEAERLMAIQSVAAAIENLLLAAWSIGLGACWMCAPLFAPEAARDALKLPGDWEPQALITVGYPAQEPRSKVIESHAKVVYR